MVFWIEGDLAFWFWKKGTCAARVGNIEDYGNGPPLEVEQCPNLEVHGILRGWRQHFTGRASALERGRVIHYGQAELVWSVGIFKVGDEDRITSYDWIGGGRSWWLWKFRGSVSALAGGLVGHKKRADLAWGQAELAWSVGIF